MANTYTSLAFAFHVPKVVATYVVDLANDVDHFFIGLKVDDQDTGQVIDEYGLDGPSGCVWSVEDTTDSDVAAVVVYSEENADLTTVTAVIRSTLNKFDLSGAVVIEYAQTCSKPRIGEFGGGVAVVTRDQVHWMNTATWAEQKVVEIGSEIL